MATNRRIKKIEQVLKMKQPDLTVVLENIHDPHNVSAILRSCDAVGIREIQLLYTVDKFPDIGKKSSASAKKWIDRRQHRSVDECYAFLRELGFTIYATRLGNDCLSLYSLDLTRKIALVFGNENRGVSEEAAEKADGTFQIPMLGMIQSLNVSVACAVTLFEALRQRHQSGHYDTVKMSQEEFNRLLKEWSEK
jgi:tRNA (guanosine-2'-O-)-methyltransferase